MIPATRTFRSRLPARASGRLPLPDLALIGIAAVWGGSYLATQQLAVTVGAAAVLCARFLPSALLLAMWTLARHRRRRVVDQSRSDRRLLGRSLRAGTILGALRAATIVLETIGVTMTSATNAGLLIGLSILLTPLIEAAITRRRLTRGLIGSVVLALIGIALLVGSGSAVDATALFTRASPGDVLILCAAVTRACLGVAEARATRGAGADVLGLTTVEIAFGAAVFTVWGGGSLLAQLPALSSADWALIAYLVLGCTILAFLGQLWATGRTSASRAGLLLGSEPLWALVIGVALGGERISATGWIGAAVLLSAMAWGRREESRWRGVAELRHL